MLALVWISMLMSVYQVIGAQNDEQNLSDSNDGLIFAHILYRHGDRNLVDIYPNDPWKNETYWPPGLGQLTNIGKQQQYELGAYLRHRYFNLMENDGSYSRNNIYIQSTDVDRTLMSASCNLAGMFPPKDQQIWNKLLMWQPIPIHTIPQEMDHVLGMSRPCPLYEKAYKEYEQSPEVQSILHKNQSLIQYLEEHSGLQIKTIDDVKTIYQAISIEKLKHFPLLSWTEKVNFPGSEMEEIAQFWWKMGTNTKLLARLKAGFLIGEILERFTMKKNSTLSPDRSLWVYSAHDTTIAHILNTLGIFETHIPPYASCLFFELHKYNGTFYVQIFYKRERGEDKLPLEPLFIPNCGQKCPLNQMYEIYQDIIPTEDFDTECRIPPTEETNKSIRFNSSSYLTLTWLILQLFYSLYIH